MHNDSILFDTITNDDTSLGSAGTTPAGLHYIYAVGKLGDKPTGVYSVALPFVTLSHLVAMPKGPNELDGFFGKLTNLEPVHLEGNYDTYFSLYTAEDQQVDSRYVLDPEAMQFSIDFCSAYAWEIFDNSLYFANDGLLPNLSVVDEFVKQITPAEAVEKKGLKLTPRPQVFEKLSTLPTHLLCPVCKRELQSGKQWFVCANGHGYLIKASDIVKTREHMDDSQRALKMALGAEPHVITPTEVIEHGDLHCPNDGQLLEKIAYQETSAHLYVCSTCFYRWIDAQDLDTILGQYRNDGEDDRD